jgi:hypothetical protein
MPSKPKSWQQRLKSDKKPVVKLLTFDFAGLKSGTTMLVSSPLEVEAYLRKIPEGAARTVERMRADLAKKHKADGACPVSSAIFLRIVSEAAFEQVQAGAPLHDVTPFWRVVTPDSPLARKLACGPDFVRAQREREGIAESS